MSEDWKIQVSLKHGQNMLNIRANTVTELVALADEAKQKGDLTLFFSPRVTMADEPTPKPVTVQDVTEEKVPSDVEALENLAKIGVTSAVTPASKSQVIGAAKKSGKSVESLAGISEADAKALIAGGTDA